MRCIMYDITVFEKPCSRLFTQTISWRFRKSSTLGTVFENLGFGRLKTLLTGGQNAKTEKKKSPFSYMFGYVST